MVRKIFILALSVCFVSGVVTAQTIWNAEHLAKVKEQIKQPVYNTAYRQLIKDADKALKKEPLSVMMKDKVAASGDKHDYLSQARYYWRDPSKPDGKPYINKDGESNPEINRLDRVRLANMAGNVTTLSLAYYFSGEEKYAEKAAEQLRVWFLDKETKMNPNLNYAQIVPGKNGDKGRCFGVIDTYSFIGMLDAVQLLEKSAAFTPADSERLKGWFSELLDWLLTSELGKRESQSVNNHGTAYDVQVLAYAKYVGRTDVVKDVLKDFYPKRILTQIEPDGRQPLELKRTLAYHYSLYNLTHILDVFFIAKNLGLEVGDNSKTSFERVHKAFDFIAGYLGKPVEAWHYKQISGWEETQQLLCKDLYRAWLLDTKLKEYPKLYHKYGLQDWSDRFTLLYLKSDRSDNGYASAAKQLRFALKCAEEEYSRGKTKNGDRLVSPRCLEKDGSLRLVVPRDWCSGFFAGNLWQMYGYTHQEEWKKAAEKYTLPIEKMKDCTGTHDLGFVVYSSFGNAYALTGEQYYKDVVLHAARSLASRYSPKVKAIRSWDHNSDKWRYPVIIDNMLNLELLFEASRLSGDDTYYNIAVNHANTTMKNHFRKDCSCYHVVSYDPQTGKPEKKNTHQGIADESVWSRGQAWGLYGYTMCYRYTRDEKYLEQARKIASFIFSQPGMPDDLVPYWDMKDPAIPNSPRDASAAAVSASALYELALYVTKEEAKGYRKTADKILGSLYKGYRSKVNANKGFLLLHSVGNYPANDEIDVPIVYADYYYLEALSRKAFMKR